jgi:glycosyltransferase involved in cell wall biosynthesis
MRALRALYILPAEGFGGAERQGVLHVANLPNEGIEVTVVTGPGQPIRTELDRALVDDYVWYPGFPGANTEAPGFFASVARPGRYGWSWWRATRDITPLARERKVDVIFASRAFGWIVGSFVGRRLGVPVVWRAGSLPTSEIQRFMLRHLAHAIAPTLLTANSEMGRQVYASLLRVPTAVLPNGVDVERFSPNVHPGIRQNLGLQQAPVIGLAARPAPGKGLDFLAKVAREVIARHPTARFLIAGEFPWRRHYQVHFSNGGLEGNVDFLGHVAEIEAFYASCDVVVLTSQPGSIEMSSNAILEAMAVGRPVVATDVGGMAEIVENGVNGMVMPAGEPELFADALCALIDNPSLRAEFGAAGRGRVLRAHSAESVSRTLGRLLQAVSTDPEGAGGLTAHAAERTGLNLHHPLADRAFDNRLTAWGAAHQSLRDEAGKADGSRS